MSLNKLWAGGTPRLLPPVDVSSKLVRPLVPQQEERHEPGAELDALVRAARSVLKLCDFLQPLTRAFARWRHGGPAPRLQRPGSIAPPGDESGHLSSETRFLGPPDAGRHQLLAVLQERGWQSCGDTRRWDLEYQPYHLLTTDEQHGPNHTMVKARLLHPPGSRREGMNLLRAAAREAGLERL